MVEPGRVSARSFSRKPKVCTLEISKYVWDTDSRPCSFSLCLERGCVFADFNVGRDGRACLVRISFDGYGCYTTNGQAMCLTLAESQTLIKAIEADEVNNYEIRELLYQYFDRNKDVIWRDALEEHGLLRANTNV